MATMDTMKTFFTIEVNGNQMTTEVDQDLASVILYLALKSRDDGRPKISLRDIIDADRFNH